MQVVKGCYFHQEDYIMREIETVDFIQLLNNRLTNFDIKPLNENNNLLQLASGVSTIVKLAVQKMPSSKKSFNIRLTSSPSNEYPSKILSKFKVKLPTSLQLDKTWRVSINSISHPSQFSTFLQDPETQYFCFHPKNGETFELLLKDNYIYSNTELVDMLKTFLQ